MIRILKAYAAAHDMTLSQVESVVKATLKSNEWKRSTIAMTLEHASAVVASWPEWKRKAVQAQLDQPYVEPPDRGEDGNARW
jgi:hypothetical protein